MNFCQKEKFFKHFSAVNARGKSTWIMIRAKQQWNQSCLYRNLKINLISNLSTAKRHVRENVDASCRGASGKIQFGVSLNVQAYFWLPSRCINLFLPWRCWDFAFLEEITAGAEIFAGNFPRKTFLSSFVDAYQVSPSHGSDKKWNKAKVMIWITTLCWLLSHQCHFNFSSKKFVHGNEFKTFSFCSFL